MRFADKIKGDYVKLTLIIILIATILRFALAAVSHPAGDACWHLSVSRFIAENGRIPFLEPFGITDREVFTAPPLFHLIAAAVYRIFSAFSVPAAETAIKFISPLFGSLTLPFIFLLGRKLYSPRIGFLATLFVAFLPLHINSSSISFVESLSGLLAVIAVYLLFCKRILLSAVFVGLSLVSKQNMFVMLPLFFGKLLFDFRGNLKSFISKSVISGIIIFLIGLPWFIRNYLLTGNPVWPFLYRFLGGRIVPHVPGLSPGVLLSFSHVTTFYLETFGVPLGNLAALAFVNLPFINILLFGWLAITFLFILPVIPGFFSMKKHRLFLYGWMALFLLVDVLYIMNTGWAQARIFLPALPALAFVWAFGLDSVISKARKLRLLPIIAVILVGCAMAFSTVEVSKAVIGAHEWSKYQADFDWVKSNTPTDALVAYRGQCLSYNINRPSNFNLGKADYVWVNQGFRLEPISILQPELLKKVEANFTKAYENDGTGTVIYRRK